MLLREARLGAPQRLVARLALLGHGVPMSATRRMSDGPRRALYMVLALYGYSYGPTQLWPRAAFRPLVACGP